MTDDNSDREEAEHFQKVVNTFLLYKVNSLKKLGQKVQWFKSLPHYHRMLIPDYMQHLRALLPCITANDEFLKQVVSSAGHIFDHTVHPVNVFGSGQENPSMKEKNDLTVATDPVVSEFYIDKLHSTLRQLVRDWSAIGCPERDICYKPIIDDVEQCFRPASGPSSDGSGEADRSSVRILVPGAGLGRLAWEFARLGYFCEGNEFSYFMLIVSNFVLNKCDSVNAASIHPWIHNWCNHVRYTDHTAAVQIPDVNPSCMNRKGIFSMAAGDFLEVYPAGGQEPSWDCVVTVFFIDTAHNVVAYIEKIFALLKPGGYWFNFGPLLYHFADIPGEQSVELPYEEIRSLMLRLGFEIVKEVLDIETTYAQNASSMLHYTYKCAYTICKKPAGAQAAPDPLCVQTTTVSASATDIGDVAMREPAKSSHRSTATAEP